MKKLISTLLVLSGIMLSFNGFAQAFTISGKWERAEKSPRLMLFEVVNGSMKFADTARIQSDRSFTFNYTPTKEGFFVVGTGQTTIKMGSYTFYMKPGDALNLVVNDSTYTLVGENTKENLAMEDWNRLVYPLERHWVYPEGVTFVEFFPLVEDVAAKTNAYSPVPTGNTLFDADFAKYRKFDVMNDALMFLQKPAKVHPKVEDFTNYYKSLKTKDVLANSDMLVYPYSMLFVKFVLTYENKINGKEGAVTEDDLIELAADDVKCDLVVAQVLSKINEEWRLEAFEAKYGKYFVTEAQKQRYESEKERIARRTKAQRIGEPGLAFTYKDVNGNDVSFSDF
ncbi:MAG: hypothetical protein LBU91_06380, partial [Bacteroidales bacterium]|nr:hypothetical protein [Bacteroidales bacterium]